MLVKVINTFNEREHKNHHYKTGDVYPTKGYTLSEERARFLAEIHPKYKKAFVEIEEKPKRKRAPKVTAGEAGD